MKKIIALLISVLLLFTLTGCSNYVSSYKAVGFVHSNKASSAFMSFYSFDGRMVFKLKSAGEGDLKYSAETESGSAKVYYDYNGEKTELFSVNGGDEIESHGGYIEKGTVYIIVETDGECQNGAFDFEINNG